MFKISHSREYAISDAANIVLGLTSRPIGSNVRW